MKAARREFRKVWDEATRILDSNPAAARDLVHELSQNPRAVSDTENALLLHRQIELQNESDKTTDESLAKIFDADDAVVDSPEKLELTQNLARNSLN